MTHTVTPCRLLAFINGRGIDEHDALMYLRDANVISDNCLGLLDVAEADCPAALSWLQWMARRLGER